MYFPFPFAFVVLLCLFFFPSLAQHKQDNVTGCGKTLGKFYYLHRTQTFSFHEIGIVKFHLFSLCEYCRNHMDQCV